MKAFLDTNVLVYAFDVGAPGKRKRAHRLFAQCAADGSLLLSVQGLQEFYVTVARKLEKPLAPEAAASAVATLATFPVVVTDAPMVRAAIRTHQDAEISFWNALIVEAARSGGAAVLYSEDLQDGRDFGGVRVANPFA
jgi:predicted nucleic acid-binding protein